MDSVIAHAVRVGLDPASAVGHVLLDSGVRAYRRASERLRVAHAGARRAQRDSGPRASLSRIAALRELEEAQADELDAFDGAMAMFRQWKGALERPDIPRNPLTYPHRYTEAERYSPLHGRVLSPAELADLAEMFA